MSYEDKNEYIKFSHDNNQHLIEFCDTKANIIIGIISILLPLVFGSSISYFNKMDDLMKYIFTTIITIGGLFIIASLLYAFRVIKGRIKNIAEEKNNIFFLSITGNSVKEYIDLIENMDSKAYFEDMAKSNHTLARINQRKYSLYNKSLQLLITGAVIVMTCLILMAALTSL